MTPANRSVIPLFGSPSAEKIQHSAKKNRAVFDPNIGGYFHSRKNQYCHWCKTVNDGSSHRFYYYDGGAWIGHVGGAMRSISS
jgi:hypothetical protein